MLTLLFDGMAYGMLLFVLALGLAVTMGLMNFINLAHGAFAMVGGYMLIVLMQRAGWPFLLCLPTAFVVTAAAGALLEATLYRRMYAKPHLEQVLFSIGLTFMAVAMIDYSMGSSPQIVELPEWLRQRFEIGSGSLKLGMGDYRLFIIAVCAALTLGLQGVLTHTRFGSRLARRGRRPARRDRPGHHGETDLPADLCRRFRTGRPGRGDGRRHAGPGSELSAQVHDLLPDRRAPSAAHHRSPARCWLHWCSAWPMWWASTTSPSWAASSSTS